MSETTLWEFRYLVLDLRDDGAPGFGRAVLEPWLAERPHVLAELHEIGRPHNSVVAADPEVLYGLYAFSRLTEILLGPHQPVNDDPALLSHTYNGPWWRGPLPDPAAWAEFLALINASTVDETAFHPFFHEIVSVVPSPDPDEPITLLAELWPGALVGGLLIARAGVVVQAGHRALDAALGERSALYFAWWRRNRKVTDLSHGWGGSSQWGTDFRRDYVVGDELHYNVDRRFTAAGDLSAGLPLDQRRELLRFRHSTTVDLGKDQWPYDDWLVEPRG
ncbi:hypothetical protein [Hamadaea tsunoensis]|uniref:hypothetical protein n=1 Tax=Hamadaea tsunoensis TaxID=53368 RepID=UPI00040F19DA|nr:hypothetical protein [Hamadaea tsunoensis]